MEKETDIGKTMIYYQTEQHPLCFENEFFSMDIIFCFYCNNDWRNDPTWAQPRMHNHFYYEIHTVLAGSCTFQTEKDNCVTVNEGEFIVFPAKYKHQIIFETAHFSKMVIAFALVPKKTKAPNFYRTAARLARKPKAHTLNNAMNYLANNIIENGREKHYEYLNVIFFSMLSYIIESLRLIVGKREILAVDEESDVRIQKAIDYIKSNISNAISVTDVARDLHTSTKQLTRIFQKNLGTTPGAYIKDYKITCICSLLTTTDLSIDDIAEFMNYPDASSMIKAFKRMKGVTPLQYRQTANE